MEDKKEIGHLLNDLVSFTFEKEKQKNNESMLKLCYNTEKDKKRCRYEKKSMQILWKDIL